MTKPKETQIKCPKCKGSKVIVKTIGYKEYPAGFSPTNTVSFPITKTETCTCCKGKGKINAKKYNQIIWRNIKLRQKDKEKERRRQNISLQKEIKKLKSQMEKIPKKIKACETKIENLLKKEEKVQSDIKKVLTKNSYDRTEHNITGGTKEVYHYSMEDGRCSGSVGSGGLCG